MTKLEEITVVYLSEFRRRDSWSVHRVRRADNGDGRNCRETGIPAQFSIVGESEPGEFRAGLEYWLRGQWDRQSRFGPQFKYESFTAAVPHSRDGIVEYLKQCRHVGDAVAAMLWDSFGGRAVDTLRDEPERAAEVAGRWLPIAKAKEAAEDLQRLRHTQEITIELGDLLRGRGWPKSCGREFIRRWGCNAVAFLRRNPYLATVARGVGFSRADALYLDLKKPPAKLTRQARCLAWSVAEESDKGGHVWIRRDRAVELLREKIGGAEVKPENALALAVRGRLLTVRTDGDGVEWTAERRRADQEDYVCRAVVRAFAEEQIGISVTAREDEQIVTEHRVDHTRCARCHRMLTAETVHVFDGQPFGPECIKRVAEAGADQVIPLAEWLDGAMVRTVETISRPVGGGRIKSEVAWPSLSEPEFSDLSEHQRQQLSLAMGGPIGILCGSPGTGKTYVLSRVVKAVARIHGSHAVAVCCPTGKAAVRCKESMSANGVDVRTIEPRTIHRLLGVASAGDGGWEFEHGEADPLPYRFIILDEASMVGTGLFRSLICARQRGAGMLIVGDVNQLSPVEYGSPLRDFLAAGLPQGELTEIRRNSGTIVRACAAIRDRETWPTDETLELRPADGSPKNLVVIPASKGTAAIKILSLIRTIRDTSPYDPTWDCQVICATNKKGEVSRRELNRQLQLELNPQAEAVKGCPFRLADKVIQTKNGFLSLAEDCGGGRFRALGGETKEERQQNQVLVCNGEFGRVLSIEDNKLFVRFDNPERIVLVPRGKADREEGSDESESTGTGCDLDLGYAVTCHKMQGSQAPLVIVALDESQAGAYGVCDRAWLYTAISRAQVACFLVGQKSTADAFCRRQFIGRRKTFMREKLAEYARKEGVVFSWW